MEELARAYLVDIIGRSKLNLIIFVRVVPRFQDGLDLLLLAVIESLRDRRLSSLIKVYVKKMPLSFNKGLDKSRVT